MRRFGIALSITLLLSSTLAVAQPRSLPMVSEVRVGVGPRLQAKAKEYGQSDVDMLARDLKADMERELQKRGRLGPGGVRLELWITDATPDHPTMEQLGRNPSLDAMRSVSKGGATIDGEEIQPDGKKRHLHFEYEQLYLRDARVHGTWGDAENTLDWFAHDYAAGRR